MLANLKVGWISVGTQLFSFCLHLIIISIFFPLLGGFSANLSFLMWFPAQMSQIPSFVPLPPTDYVHKCSRPVKQWPRFTLMPFWSFFSVSSRSTVQSSPFWKTNYPTSSQNNMWWKANKITDNFSNKLPSILKTVCACWTMYRVLFVVSVSVRSCILRGLHQLADYIITLDDKYVPIQRLKCGQQIWRLQHSLPQIDFNWTVLKKTKHLGYSTSNHVFKKNTYFMNSNNPEMSKTYGKHTSLQKVF